MGTLSELDLRITFAARISLLKTNALVSENLWQAIRPLLPPELAKPKGGRSRVSDRAALAGIIYILKTGIPWGMPPKRWDTAAG